MANNSLLNTSSRGKGNAGSINILANNTVLVDDSLINSNVGSRDRDQAVGQVGSVRIEAREITFQDTAQIQTGLFSGAMGDPGVVVLKAQESITLTGENTGIFTNNDPNSTGDASSSSLFAPAIVLNDSAFIEASNFGEGNGGNTTITADNLILGNNAFISGSTVSGTGGIVNLFIAENLILDTNNTIEAQAVNEANGGNLTIDAEFIIAFPNKNNDIIASANQGNGGNINITAESIFGLEARSSTPANITNDIDASSQFGLDGDISIDTPDVDPTGGIDSLPVNIIDASGLITRTCLGGGKEQEANKFIITGRGGLPNNPNEALTDDATLSADWVSLLEENDGELNQQSNVDRFNTNTVNSITEAKGWKVNSQGKVILTAEANTSNTPNSYIPWLDSYSCNAQS